MKKRHYLPFIGLFILLYLIIRVGINNILESLFKIKLGYLPLIFLFLILITIISGYKILLILRKQNINLSLGYLIKITLISYFYGTITPAKIGYLAKIFYLKKKTGKKLSEVSSSVIVDRVLDTFSLLLFATIGSFLIIGHYSNLDIILIILLVVLSFLFWFFMNKERSKIVLKIIYLFLIPKKYHSDLKETFNNFYDNIPKIKHIILPFILTMIGWILNYTIIYLIAQSLEVKINYFSFIFIYALITIISLIPITIAGLGTREAGAMLILGLFGVEASKTIIISLLGFLFTDVLLSIIGFYFSLKEGKYEGINNNSV